MDSLNAPSIPTPHPCVKCGACCATYRVLFSPAEVHTAPYNVPKDLTEKVDDQTRAMIGTNQHRPRCLALGGHIGKEVGCLIYLNRPSCCREFIPSYENGLKNPRCDEARKGKGLRALRPSDWAVVEGPEASPSA